MDRVASQPFLDSENYTLGYTMVNPHPSMFCRFETIPECDEKTNERTDEFAVAYTTLAKLTLACCEKKHCMRWRCGHSRLKNHTLPVQ